jgi:hypothetical protein
LDALKEAGIGVPYPQREILFRNSLPLSSEGAAAAPQGEVKD